MIINIPSNYSIVFRQYLTIINGLLSKKKRLTPIEIDVLDKMLYIDNLYKHLPKDKRDIILFHKNTKDKIRESLLNMSLGSFDNVLNQLRKKGMIVERMLKIHVPIIDNNIKLEFNIDINVTKES